MSDQQRPEDIAWYLDIIRGDATLGDLYGPQHVSEVLFGVTHRRLGRVAFDATKAGRGHQVAIVASAAGLLEPDVLADLIEEATSAGVVACWGLPDPANDGPAVLRRLLQRVDAGARRDVLRGLLLRLPSGITPALAETVAHDDHIFAQIIQQATWPAIETALRRRLDLGLDCRPFVGDLRSRGVVAHTVTVTMEHLELIERIGAPDLFEHCLDAAITTTTEQLRSTDSEAWEAVYRISYLLPYDPGTATTLFDQAIRHPSEWVRMIAARDVGGLARIAPDVAISLLDVALGDPEAVVRQAAANSLGELAPIDPSATVGFLERLLLEPDPDLGEVVGDALSVLADFVPDIVARITSALIPNNHLPLDAEDFYRFSQVNGALETLARHMPEYVFDVVETAVHSQQRWIRDGSSAELGRLLSTNDPARYARFIESAIQRCDWSAPGHDYPPGYKSYLIEQLATVGRDDPHLATRLMTGLLDDADTYRKQILREISDLARHDAVTAFAVLGHARQHPDLELRLCAIGCLGNFIEHDSDFVFELVQTTLDDDSTDSKVAIMEQLEALGAARPESTRRLAEQALDDPEQVVRLRAATYLFDIDKLEPHDLADMVRVTTPLNAPDIGSREIAEVHALSALLPHDRSLTIELIDHLVGAQPDDPRRRSLLTAALRRTIDNVRLRLHLDADPGIRSHTHSGKRPYEPDRITELVSWITQSDDHYMLTDLSDVATRLLPYNSQAAVDLMTAFLDDSREAVRTGACRQLPRFALHDPVLAAPLLLQADRNGLLHDPETRIELARLAPGVLCDPLWGVVHGIDRSLAGVQDADQQLAEVTTADQLIGLISIFPVDPLVDRLLTGATVDIGDVAFTFDLLRNQAQLRQNADFMGNCTEGYEHRLSEGDILVVVRDPKGQPAYNAHISRRPGRWIVLEVNSRFNAGGKECDTVRAELVRLLDPS